MGVSDKHTAVGEAEDWPAELRLGKTHRRRTRRSQSPSREVSPVHSYYSEPVSVQQRKEVTSRLLPLIRWAHQEEEDDEEDTQSLKSLPTVMNTLAFDSKVNRSHRGDRGQVISDLKLPPLVTSKCSLVVRGTGCTRVSFLPAIRSRSLERPPCRAGCRPHKLHTDALQAHTVAHRQNASISDCHHFEKQVKIRQNLPSSSAVPEPSPGPHISFQSPVVQAVYSITPDTMRESRQTVRTHQPPRPVLKKVKVPEFHCLFEKGYFPYPGDPHLLNPLSGFQEHLRQQILNSPLPCNTALPQAQPHYLLQQRDCSYQGQYISSTVRTVELCNSQSKRLPRITMTCPTPSPKHLPHTGKRHLA